MDEERDFAREADVPERAVRSYSAPITLPHFQKFDSPPHYLTPALFYSLAPHGTGSLLITVNVSLMNEIPNFSRTLGFLLARCPPRPR